MSRSGKSGDGRRAVTPDEAALWDHATRALAPVKVKPRVTETAPAAPPRSPQSEPPTRTASHSPPKGAPRPPPAPTRPPPPPPRADLDRRQTRRIASGRLEIDARIDLHGMRQSDAHMRLRGFLLDAHARGLKTVLVITGKGGEAQKGDYMADAFGQPRRGVLRRNVPAWLDEPELRAVVVGYTTAGVRHGGEGALYVQLRRPPRRDDGDA
ncbi:MAG: Smr/MutS family protein [Hyphomicrobiaceae bacterium]|jgi:DNA-nicking Smr family endonuclease